MSFRPFIFFFLVVFALGTFARAQDIDSYRQCSACTDEQLKTFFNETATPYAGFSLLQPQGLVNEGDRRSIILFHGLSDSPYYLKDLAALFYRSGFDVFVPLIKAHGDDYAGFERIKQTEWTKQTETIFQQVSARYENVSLGGFSNGGLLATRLSVNPDYKDKIRSLYLFSPALRLPFLSLWVGRFAGLVESLKKVLRFENVDRLVQRFLSLKVVKDNCVGCAGAVRYADIPLNAVRQVQAGGEQLRRVLKNVKVQIPTFMVLSSADTVINSNYIKKLFVEKFSGAKHLFWIDSTGGVVNTSGIPTDQITVIKSEIPVLHSSVTLKESQLAKPTEVNGNFSQLQSTLVRHMVLSCRSLFP